MQEQAKADAAKTESTPATTPAQAATPAVAEQPAPELAKVVAQPAQAESDSEIKQGLHMLRGFGQALKSALGITDSTEKVVPVVQAISDIAQHVTPDFAKKGGNLDELAKAVITLNQAVAGVQFDRDGVAVRTAKLFDVVESVGMLKPMAKVAAVETPAVVAAEQPKLEEQPKPATEAAANKETDQMTPEQTAKLQADVTAEVTDKVTSKILGEFREAGLLPKVAAAEPAKPVVAAVPTPTETIEEQPKVEEDTTAPAATPAAPAVVAEPATEPATEPAKPADPLNGLGDLMTKLTASVEGLGTRLEKIEKMPAGRQSIDGQDDQLPKKGGGPGKFKGALNLDNIKVPHN